MGKPIGVGIIGANPDRGWAAWAHIPAITLSPDFELKAISTSRKETAERAGLQFGVEKAYDNHMALVTCPEVELVVVSVKVPAHYELVSAALEAGKAVYCEWPLGNGLEESRKLAEMARQKGVFNAVGLQARSAPAVNYVHDLIKQGYVGEVLSTTLVASCMNWGPVMEQANAYTADKKNGATMLTIPLAHTVEALCHCLGEFRELVATTAVQRRSFTVSGTGESKRMTAEDQVAINGVLTSGAIASVHYRGGESRGTNMLWEINGTEGDIRLTSDHGHGQIVEMTVQAGRGEVQALGPLPVPEEYYLAGPDVAPFARNVAEAYARLAKDWHEGTRLVPTFDDAVRRHEMVEAIEQAAATGNRQSYI